MAKCKTCGGTGKVFQARSWFPADGFTKHKCDICAGTGESNFRPNPDYARFQSERRKAEAA